MDLEFTVEHRPRYTVVRLGGEPALDEFLLFIERAGRQARDWPNDRALFDMRGVRSLKAFTEQYAIGEAVGRHLAHLRKMASVIPADRLTRATEKTARLAGAALTVFTNEGEAIDWLMADEP